MSYPDPGMRNEGAAVFALVRNLGQATGISLLQVMTTHNAAAVQSRLVEGIGPDSPMFGLGQPDFDFSATASLVEMERQIAHQAMMVAYTDAFWALLLLSVVLLPIILLMRPPQRQASDGAREAAVE